MPKRSYEKGTNVRKKERKGKGRKGDIARRSCERKEKPGVPLQLQHKKAMVDIGSRSKCLECPVHLSEYSRWDLTERKDSTKRAARRILRERKESRGKGCPKDLAIKERE